MQQNLAILTYIFLSCIFGVFLFTVPSYGANVATGIAKINGSNSTIIAEMAIATNATYTSEMVKTSHDFFHDGVSDHIYVMLNGINPSDTDLYVTHLTWNGTSFDVVNTFIQSDNAYEGADIKYIPSSNTITILTKFTTFFGDYKLLLLDGSLSSVLTSITHDTLFLADTPRRLFYDQSNSMILATGSKEDLFTMINQPMTLAFSLGIPINGPFVETIGRIPYDSITNIAKLDNGEGDYEFQLHDGNNWYYHNGVTWTIESGQGYPNETNTLTELNSQLASFPSPGDLAIRSFLVSDGNEVPELDSLSVSYTASFVGPPPAPTPSGHPLTEAEAFIARYYPLTPRPITASPLRRDDIPKQEHIIELARKQGEQCMSFVFYTRTADDTIESNNPATFILWDQSGAIGDTGISAVPNAPVYTMYVCGYAPNHLINNVRVSAQNVTGRSGLSTTFPPSYTLPNKPELFILLQSLKSVDAQ